MSIFRIILNANGLYNTDVPDYSQVERSLQANGNNTRQLPVSRLGTAVFCWLEIEGGSYQDVAGNDVAYEGFTLGQGNQLNNVLFTVNQTKNIVKTTVQGRNGTIKEYISDGDYVVNITLAIISPNPNEYPETEVAKMHAILKASNALQVNSWWLRQFGIYNLVVESWDAPQERGSQNIQLFQLNCVSDTPAELTFEASVQGQQQDDALSVTEVKEQGPITANLASGVSNVEER